MKNTELGVALVAAGEMMLKLGGDPNPKEADARAMIVAVANQTIADFAKMEVHANEDVFREAVRKQLRRNQIVQQEVYSWVEAQNLAVDAMFETPVPLPNEAAPAS